MLKTLKGLIPYLIIILVVIVIRSFIITPVKVKGTSMYPTLKGEEIMLLNKLGKIERFDIVVLKLEKVDDYLIKRVIGMPGETIEVIHNEIYINDKKIEDVYGYGDSYDSEKITLGEDEYYVLGDNRHNSSDSHIFGKIKASDIKGTTNFIIFPFKEFGKLE